MEQTYHFGRSDNIDPTGDQVSSDITTSIRGQEPSFDAVMSGIQSFVIACGFDIGDSGIAPVAPPAE